MYLFMTLSPLLFTEKDIFDLTSQFEKSGGGGNEKSLLAILKFEMFVEQLNTLHIAILASFIIMLILKCLFFIFSISEARRDSSSYV